MDTYFRCGFEKVAISSDEERSLKQGIITLGKTIRRGSATVASLGPIAMAARSLGKRINRVIKSDQPKK